MNFKDVLKLALKNVGFKALRSWLTIIGIIIGIASIIGLMTFGDSINEGIESQLSTLGSDNIVIQPGAPVQGMRGGPGVFQQEESTGYLDKYDADELRKIDNIEAVSPIVSERYEIEYGDEIASLTVNFITPSEYEKVNSGMSFEEGFMISDTDNDRAVIGYGVAHNVFNDEIQAGDTIIINKYYEFRVEGILEEEGMGGSDNNILISMEYAGNIIDEWDENYDSIIVKLKNTDLIKATTADINKVLRDSHDVEEGEEDFNIQDYSGMIDMVSEMITLLTALLTGIASISLLVGGISISNSMFTSVFERTREIGIMKAIGADDEEIKLLFLTESMIISLIGGIGGIIIGLGFAQVIISLAPVLFSGLGNISLIINPLLLVEALLFSVIIGVLSGYFPADRASNLDPIEAIWYE